MRRKAPSFSYGDIKRAAYERNKPQGSHGDSAVIVRTKNYGSPVHRSDKLLPGGCRVNERIFYENHYWPRKPDEGIPGDQA